jgi:hypothetical protein
MADVLRLENRHTGEVLRLRRVFPLIVTIGRVLGKYRGVNWPGCPESCTGAPEMEPADG